MEKLIPSKGNVYMKKNILTNEVEPFKIYNEIRCPACRKLIACGRIQLGSLEIKCRCGALVKISKYGIFLNC
jgi:hypothetical protein